MSRTVAAIALIASFTLAACTGREWSLPTDPAAGPRPRQETSARPTGASGHADITFEFRTMVFDSYSFNAHLDPRGGVHGQFEFRTKYENVGVRVHGRVDCVTVLGNKARMGGTVTHTTFDEIPVGSQLTWSVTDNGEPGAGTDTASALLGANAEAYCANGLPYPEFPTARGNIQVR